MITLELRWLQQTVRSLSPASSVDLPPVLQYRVQTFRTMPESWSEWMDVPLHREFVELEKRA